MKTHDILKELEKVLKNTYKNINIKAMADDCYRKIKELDTLLNLYRKYSDIYIYESGWLGTALEAIKEKKNSCIIFSEIGHDRVYYNAEEKMYYKNDFCIGDYNEAYNYLNDFYKSSKCYVIINYKK